MVGRLQIEIKTFILLSFLSVLLVDCKSPSKPTDNCLYTNANLKSGDIILRKSYGLVSEIVVIQLGDTLDISHCGIIQKTKTGNFNVIHCLSKKVSDSDGVQICSLKHFLDDSKMESVRVFRFRADTNSFIIKSAEYYLQRIIPFDEKFDAADSSAFFCSEFPIHIIKSGYHTDISEGSPKPKFSIFLNKKYFDEVRFSSVNRQELKLLPIH